MGETALVALISGLGGALIAALGTLGGIALQQRHTEKRWSHEEQRWHAEPYRQRRYDALANLHAALTDCLPSFALSELPADWSSHLHQRWADLHRASMFASVYLEKEDDRKMMQGALEAFRESIPPLIDLLHRGGDTAAFDVPLGRYLACYKTADARLQDLLNPAPLKK